MSGAISAAVIAGRAGRRLAALLVAAALLAGCGGGSEGEGRPAADPGAPNVIVITLDDATAEQVNRESMPAAFTGLAERGTAFSDFIVPMPLCCPSRAAYLTGQYGHNNHVLKNDYRRLGSKGNILPRWLQLAGYRTAHVGKYLNNFKAALDQPTDVPWGWDEWYTLLDNGYYDYGISDNGAKTTFGNEPDDYVTRVLNRRAVEFVRDAAGTEQPFYLQLDHYAPHPHVGSGRKDTCRGGAAVDPDDYAALRDPEPPRKRALHEIDVSDKPWFIRRTERLTPAQQARRRTNYLCALAALKPVDRGVGALLQVLERKGVLEETAIFLTSDNGFFYGEHRIGANKEFPYEENLRMPLWVRLPQALAASPPVAKATAPAANIDLAPTILELAGAEPCEGDDCRPIDGRSLLPLLQSADPDWPADRALLVELDQSPSGRQSRPRPCSFAGVRQSGRIYVEHRTAAAPGTPCRETDATEHYDLQADPDQLENLAGTGRATAAERRLRRKLEQLRDCEGNVTDAEPGPSPCE